MDAPERDNSFPGNGPSRAPSGDSPSARAASEATEATKQTAQSVAGNAKRITGDEAEATASAIGDVAAALQDSGQAKLSEASAALAQKLHGFAGYLENRSIDDLLDDARRLAARNPGLLIAGGVVLGVAMSRFLKASMGSTPSALDRRHAGRSRDDYATEDLRDIGNGEDSDLVTRGGDAEGRSTH